MKKRIFECDTCGKETEKRMEGNTCYPYEGGWIYLYEVNITPNKITTPIDFVKKLELAEIADKSRTLQEAPQRPSIRDKHFCCKSCVIKFFEEIL